MDGLTEYNLTVSKTLQTSIDSNFTVYKIGEIETLNSIVDSVTINIQHNLGYIPAFVAYRSNNKITWHRIPYQEEVVVLGDPIYYSYIGVVNKIELVLTVKSFNEVGGASVTPNTYFKYFIFRERVK